MVFFICSIYRTLSIELLSAMDLCSASRKKLLFKHMGFIGAIPVCSGYVTVLNCYNETFDTFCLIVSMEM